MKRLFKGWFEFDPFYVNMNEHFNERENERMSDLFKVHLLNKEGLDKAFQLSEIYKTIEAWIEEESPDMTRAKSLALTKLEESCFFAKKTIAVQTKYQKGE